MWEVHPLIRRQLKHALRGQPEWRLRWHLSGGIAIGVLIWMGYVWLADVGRCGDFLFQVLLGVALYRIIYDPLETTADLLIEERRHGTYELLFLSGLRPLEIFISKLAGAALVSGYRVLCILPFFALPLAGGGINIYSYLYTLALLPLLFLFVLCLGILGSALAEEESAARSLAWGIMILLSGLPYLVQYIGNHVTGTLLITQEWLALSPAFGPVLLFQGFSAVSWPFIIQNALYLLGYSMLALAIASVVVKRTWRLNQVKRFGQRSRWWGWVRKHLTGDASARPAYLETAPMRWLAGYELRPVLQAWLAMLFLFGVWLLLIVLFSDLMFRIVPLVATITVFSLVYASFTAYTAARRLALDKADGQLEILLTAPLTSEDIVVGLRDGVAAQFRQLRFFNDGLWALLIAAGILTRSWNWQAVLVYVMIWANVWMFAHVFSKQLFSITIKHVIVSGKPMAAVMSVFSFLGGMSYAIYNVVTSLSGNARPYGTTIELVIASCVTLVIFMAAREMQDDFKAKLLAPAKNLRTIVAGDYSEEEERKAQKRALPYGRSKGG